MWYDPAEVSRLPLDAVGIAEIAAMCGMPRKTVAVWKVRGKLPPPDQDLAMGPVWERAVIERWLEAHPELRKAR